MTPVLLIAIAAVLALGAVLTLVVGRIRATTGIEQLADRLDPIDVEAFRNLIDEGEEEFLRQHLPASEFRAVHRERLLAASEYVRGAARNAGILIRLAEAARESSDPAVASIAENLQANAFRMRLYAWKTLPRIYAGILMPWANGLPRALPETYDSLTRQLVTLKCLQSPVAVSKGM